MDDLRKSSLQKDIDRSKLIYKYITIMKSNWWKILLGIIFIFIILFPNLFGEFIGKWYSDFTTELTKNIIK